MNTIKEWFNRRTVIRNIKLNKRMFFTVNFTKFTFPLSLAIDYILNVNQIYFIRIDFLFFQLRIDIDENAVLMDD